MEKIVRIALVLGLLATLGTVPATAHDGSSAGGSSSANGTKHDPRRIALELGESAFWDGELIESSVIPPTAVVALPVEDPLTDACMVITGRCISYDIEVLEAGGTLRLAMDHPDNHNMMGVSLYDPSGDRVKIAGNGYSAEVRAADAVVGTWRAVVIPYRVQNEFFRMRAFLEPAPEPEVGDVAPRPLLPDLRVSPPFKLTFKGPVAPPNPQGTYNSEWFVTGSNAVPSCRADETEDFKAVECLRFSVGPESVGDGPLRLRFEPLEGLVDEGTTYQIVNWSDGSTTERPAGTFQYHKEHGHYHHQALQNLHLHKVVDPKRGVMLPAGEGPKQGMCMGPSAIARWGSFENDKASSVTSDCSMVTAPGGAHMGLARGWTDIYDWFLYGNFVEFGDNEDGLYVVNTTTDPKNTIEETDETNNTAYAYFRVATGPEGREIKVIERGYGTSPWDRNNEIAGDIRPPVLP